MCFQYKNSKMEADTSDDNFSHSDMDQTDSQSIDGYDSDTSDRSVTPHNNHNKKQDSDTSDDCDNFDSSDDEYMHDKENMLPLKQMRYIMQNNRKDIREFASCKVAKKVYSTKRRSKRIAAKTVSKYKSNKSVCNVYFVLILLYFSL